MDAVSNGGEPHMIGMGDVPPPSPWVRSSEDLATRIVPRSDFVMRTTSGLTRTRRLLPGATGAQHSPNLSNLHVASLEYLVREVIHPPG